MRSRNSLPRWLALACVATLAACATDRPHRGARAVSDTPVKIGAPYRAGGRTWVPADDRGYDALGYASWYGGGHAGRPTANGERFDPRGFSAAHPTLPLPSYVEVTALDSGRTILVRVNDRGPFVAGRILDLSAGAAQALGIARQGIARVRVRRVQPGEGDRAALRAGRAAGARPEAGRQMLASLTTRFPGASVQFRSGPAAAALSRPAPPAASLRPTPSLPPAAVRADVGGDVQAGSAMPSLFVQIAALADADRADGLAASLGGLGPAVAIPAGALWQVRLGPFADAAAARSVLARAQAAGYQDARVVSDSAKLQEDR